MSNHMLTFYATFRMLPEFILRACIGNPRMPSFSASDLVERFSVQVFR